jgi:DNA polymerase-3 subunit delta'
VSFDRLIGQEWLSGRLREAIRADRLPHALLIVGAPGSGKRALAREIGKALLCEGGTGDGCDACRACRLVEHGNHPDFAVFSRQPEDSFVRIEAARALIAALALRPFGGGRKVAVLPEVNLLTEAAANCLLKTLEEPPGDAVLLLLADSAAEVLPTVLSRCQIVKVAPLAPEVVAEALKQRHGVPADRAAYAGAMSGGSLGRALELVEPDCYDMKRWVVEQFSALTPETVFTVTDELTGRLRGLGGTPAAFREVLCRSLAFAAALYRDVASAGAVAPIHADQAACQPRGLRPEAAAELADLILAAQTDIQANANPGLVLDVLLLEISHRQAV